MTDKTIIEAAFLAGYEPSKDGMANGSIAKEATEFLTKLF